MVPGWMKQGNVGNHSTFAYCLNFSAGENIYDICTKKKLRILLEIHFLQKFSRKQTHFLNSFFYTNNIFCKTAKP